jgi:hypothetical protein
VLYEGQDRFAAITQLVRIKLAGRLLGMWDAVHSDVAKSTAHIKNLRAYVGAITRNACTDFLRRKYPGRHSLDLGLRAFFESSTDYGCWRVPVDRLTTEWHCGHLSLANPESGRHRLLLIAADIELQAVFRRTLDGMKRSQAVSALLDIASSPVRYSELLTFLADFWDVEAPFRASDFEQVSFRVSKPYVVGIQPEESANLIGMLQTLWPLIVQLSQPQAAVVLLKLPEYKGISFLEAFVYYDIADWDEIARLTKISTRVLDSLVGDLPLTDRQIAALIDVTEDSVPRMRQDARIRLNRLMRALDADDS